MQCERERERVAREREMKGGRERWRADEEEKRRRTRQRDRGKGEREKKKTKRGCSCGSALCFALLPKSEHCNRFLLAMMPLRAMHTQRHLREHGLKTISNQTPELSSLQRPTFH